MRIQCNTRKGQLSGSSAGAEPPIDVFSWNWRLPAFSSRVGRRIPIDRWVNNFGDLLGPPIVAWAAKRHGIDLDSPAGRRARLLSIGSVLHEASDGDVIWGAGRNGLVPDRLHRFNTLDIRSVRGPLTKSFLEDRGVLVPPVFGDPALLLPMAMPWVMEWTAVKRYELTIVPNYMDMRHYRGNQNVLDPRSSVGKCLRRIAQSEFVIGSSLHGVIVAEALGIGARAVRATFDPEFKYRDYYAGTGRPDAQIATNVADALSMGPCPPPVWSSSALLDAFPVDLWGRDEGELKR